MTTLITFMMALGADPAAKLDFKKDIAPIFSQHCLECHGAGKQRGGLRLDRADLAMRGGIQELRFWFLKSPKKVFSFR